MPVITTALAMAACQADLPQVGTPTTGRQLIEASSRVHDPEGRWSAFAAAFEIATVPAGAVTGWSNTVYLDRVRDTFSRAQEASGYELLQTQGVATGCRASWTRPNVSQRDSMRLGIGADDCRAVERQRNFYAFLLGLPMSALEGGGVFSEPVDTVDFRGETALVVRLAFPTDDTAPAWWLYISPEDYLLTGAKFEFASGSGEVISYPLQERFDGFLLKPRQEWYRLDAVTPISVDELEFLRIR